LASAAALVALGAACGPVDDGAQVATSTAWTREGLEEQPRMEQLRRGASGALGYEPATTPWEEIAYAPPARSSADPPPDSPGEVLARVAPDLGWMDSLGEGVWEQTMRVWAPDPGEAVGVVLQWGFQDDAVAGRDLRAHMLRVDGAWRVERLEQRFHCRRGVSEGGQCV
jgi:hypothetical protein